MKLSIKYCDTYPLSYFRNLRFKDLITKTQTSLFRRSFKAGISEWRKYSIDYYSFQHVPNSRDRFKLPVNSIHCHHGTNHWIGSIFRSAASKDLVFKWQHEQLCQNVIVKFLFSYVVSLSWSWDIVKFTSVLVGHVELSGILIQLICVIWNEWFAKPIFTLFFDLLRTMHITRQQMQNLIAREFNNARIKLSFRAVLFTIIFQCITTLLCMYL